MFKIILKITEMAQNYVKLVLKERDVAVDATLGNGNDTIFLSGLVPEGRVYSFEIQRECVKKFKKEIEIKGIRNVEVINDGHENMDLYIKESPKAIMFNLGYLPRGNKNVITRPETTVAALKKGLKMLSPGGIITIAVYRGHEGGEEEGNAVLDFINGLDPKIYNAMVIKYVNRKGMAPFLLVIEKNCSVGGDKYNSPGLL